MPQIDKEDKANHFDIIYAIIQIEHVCSYLAFVFREYDIRENGTLDINGIRRAPRESLLANIQMFLYCAFFGYTVKLLTDLGPENFHKNAYVTYWLMIDMIVMFCFSPYINWCQKF